MFPILRHQAVSKSRTFGLDMQEVEAMLEQEEKQWAAQKQAIRKYSPPQGQPIGVQPKVRSDANREEESEEVEADEEDEVTDDDDQPADRF
mmetsp:Transcript_20464/g.30487  ORF Transcript_20464/g.30487 Transcript_20464/m.30487 type:complete len:91 (+) Transcript_20464:146-418(+)